LLKPLAWQGDVSLGSTAGRATFQRLDRNPRWAGIPDPEDAGSPHREHSDAVGHHRQQERNREDREHDRPARVDTECVSLFL